MVGARGPNPEPGEGGGGTNRDKLICFARLGQAGGAGSALAVQGQLVGHRGPVCARFASPVWLRAWAGDQACEMLLPEDAPCVSSNRIFLAHQGWRGSAVPITRPVHKAQPVIHIPPLLPPQAVPSIFLAPRNSPLEKSWEKLSDEYVMGARRMCVRDL